MQIYDLVDMDELQELRERGLINEQNHPYEPLAILNYTDKAQLSDAKLWADFEALSHCRGLIYNRDNGEIVARPFRKFWNYGQAGADEIGMFEPVYTVDKLDGSLGIMYRQPNGGLLAIATRGSFTSDQALHATRLLQTRYSDVALWGPEDPREKYSPADEETFLFEIIYPQNRIVLNYGSTNDLFLLGSMEIDNGFVFHPEQARLHLRWAGPVAPGLSHETLSDALAAAPRPNREGMVVATRGGGRMVKLKQEDYLRLHKLVFGLTEKSVWRAVVAGDSLESLLEPLPDEFHPWVREIYGRIKGAAATWAEGVREEYGRIMDSIAWDEFDERGAKKEFARIVQGDKDSWAYFQLYTGRGASIEQRYIEKYLEPVGATGPTSLNNGQSDEVCAELAAGSRCPGCMGCPRDEEG
jgi:RNA ligase